MKPLIRTLRVVSSAPSYSPAHWPPRYANQQVGGFALNAYWRVALLLAATFTLSIIGLLFLSGTQGRQPNPFSVYRNIMPGQSRDSVLRRGFKCQFNQIMPSLEETCSLTPETGIFSEIQVRFVSAPYMGKVSQTIFKPREKMLPLGDLVLLWGRPEIAIYGQTVNLHWRNVHVVAIPQTYHGHFSYWLPIVYLAFQPVSAQRS